MPTLNRPWRAFFIRWCCCRPRCSGDCRAGDERGARTRARTHRAARQSQGRTFIGWSRRCSGFIPRSGGSAGRCSKNASAPATSACSRIGHDGGEYAAGILAVCRHCRAGASYRPRPLPAISRGAFATSSAMRGLPSLGAIKAISLLVATIGVTAAPLFAGAVRRHAHRQELLTINSRALGSAEFSIEPAVAASPRRSKCRRPQRSRDPQHHAARPHRARLRRGTLEVVAARLARFAALRLRAVTAGPVSDPITRSASAAGA